eukprot:5032782-Pyramimonas_sp.AAC.1
MFVEGRWVEVTVQRRIFLAESRYVALVNVKGRCLGEVVNGEVAGSRMLEAVAQCVNALGSKDLLPRLPQWNLPGWMLVFRIAGARCTLGRRQTRRCRLVFLPPLLYFFPLCWE